MNTFQSPTRSVPCALAGCSKAPPAGNDAKPSAAEKSADGYDTAALAKRIEASMAALSAEDRKLAESQKFCPVGVEFDEGGKPVRGLLGTIGKPVKLMVKDQPVFIMCPSCTEEFKGNTDKYMEVLAKIKVDK